MIPQWVAETLILANARSMYPASGFKNRKAATVQQPFLEEC